MPNPGFEGLETFTYTVTHPGIQYNDGITQADPGGTWVDRTETLTTNTATVTIEVGKAVRANLTIEGLDEEDEDQGGGKYLVLNSDDDNKNTVQDRHELIGPIRGEDDLVRVDVDYWRRADTTEEDFTAKFVMASSLYGAVRLWTTADKEKEIIPYLSGDPDYWGEDFLLADLPSEIYVEGTDFGTGFLRLDISAPQSTLFSNYAGVTPYTVFAATEHEDTVKLTVVDVDLDIDSDNNDGFGVPERSDWEEFLEDNLYGLGKLVMQNYGIPDAAPNFTPLILSVSPDNPDLIVRFEFVENSAAGTIELWTRDKNDPERVNADLSQGGHRVSPYVQYTLEELGDSVNGVFVLYIAGVAENPDIKTLKGVETHGKPNDGIGVTLIDGGGSNYVAGDFVKYIVTQTNSFFYELQNSQALRNGLASRGVYSRKDMPEFSLEPLGPGGLAELDVPPNIVGLLGPANGVPGFNAVLYRDYITGGPNQYALAFAGTDDYDDILEDLWQGLGLYSEQYAKAIEIGEGLKDVQIIANGLITTGHSLGGGLASAASLSGGIQAHTFNAAGLHVNTVAMISNPIGAQVDAFYIDWDLLSFVQDNVWFIPSAYGDRHELDGPYDLEVAAGILLGLLSIYTGNSWLGLAVGLGEAGVLGLAHRIDVVLYGLLVDEGTAVDLMGYEFGLPD